jgi:LysR family transcriptional regulator, nitrogen assimilation regulatory protein
VGLDPLGYRNVLDRNLRLERPQHGDRAKLGLAVTVGFLHDVQHATPPGRSRADLISRSPFKPTLGVTLRLAPPPALLVIANATYKLILWQTMGPAMDIRQLRYFVSVVDMGSLSKAAGTLAISQPSLSQQVIGMEFDLGVPLLLRSATGVRPTEAGTKLYRHARVILRQMQEMRVNVVSEGSGVNGQVAVGLPTSIAAVLAAPLLERLRTQHPGIRLELFESFSGYLGEFLANGRLDMAVLFRDTESPGAAVRPLFTEFLSVLGAPSTGDPQANTCDLTQLAGVPLVLPGRSNSLRLLIERVFTQAGVELNVVADVDSLPAMLALARDGVAATIGSIGVARTAHPPILARRLVTPSIVRPVCLCIPTAVPQNAASLATEETIQTLAREFGQLWDKVS